MNFLNQYAQAGGKAKLDRRLDHGRPDRAELEGRRQAPRDRHALRPARRPTCWDNPKWQAWVKAYQDAFPADKRFTSPVADRHRLLQRLQRGVPGAQRRSTATSATATRSSAPASPRSSSTRRTARSSSTRTARRSARTSSPRWSRLPNGDLVNKVVKIVPERAARRSASIRSSLRQARPAEPHQSGVQDRVLTPVPTSGLLRGAASPALPFSHRRADRAADFPLARRGALCRA